MPENNPYDFENLNIGLQYNTQVPSFDFGPGFWFSITTLFIVVVLFIFWRAVRHKINQVHASLGMAILLVRLPREVGQPDAAAKQDKPASQQIQEQISVAEILLSGLVGLKPHSFFRKIIKKCQNFILGRSDHYALEIVADNGMISFYVAIPRKNQAFVEQQINAQYPHAQIEEEPDYNIFSPQGVAVGSYMKLARGFAYPIKTYKQFETDPLNSITNVMSKIPTEYGAAVQLVVRSAPTSWRSQGVKLASRMQQGKNSSDASGRSLFSKGLSALGGMVPTSASQPDQKMKPPTDYKLSPLEQEMVKGIEQKASKAGFEIVARVVAMGENQTTAEMYLRNILNAFAQFNIYEYGNAFVFKHPWNSNRFFYNFIHRTFQYSKRFILNTEELASLFHFPLPSSETPNIRWLAARRASAPVNIPKIGLTLGINYYRGEEVEVKIKDDDRRRHMYIIGKSGTGKSVLLENMIVQDIKAGKGVCVVDPHGDLVEGVLRQVPVERADDVIVFDPSDIERPMGLNMLEFHDENQKDFVVQEMIAIFYKLFPPEMIGPMFEHNMRNVMLTLMADESSPGTIADIPRMFTDPAFQKYKVSKLKDVVVRAFWEKEMAKTSDFHKSEMLGYLISKVGRFVENEMMRNIIGQAKSGFDFREVMDKGKILLVNLSKGKTGEVNSSLLGLIVVSKLQMAAMARANMAESERNDFYLYIDEFQNFITDSISTILSEARKYRLDLIIAHQYLGQLMQDKGNTKVRDAVLGTTGTIISFKIGVEDAELIAKEFAPVFSAYDLVNVEQYNAYIKLLIDNAPSRPFNMRTLPPGKGDATLAEKIKALSRLKYARSRAEVDADIMDRTKLGEAGSQGSAPASEATL